MLRFYAAPFVKSINQLQILLGEAERWTHRRPKDSRLNAKELKHVLGIVLSVDHECEKLRLKRALETIALFKPEMPNWTLEVLQLRTRDIQKRVFMDLYDPAFVFVPSDAEEYFDQSALFDGDEVKVSKCFSEAGADIRAAGNCYAVGLYTACVFHLMRVVEIGARKMIADLKARQYLTNSKKPVELCDWGELIAAINKSVDALRGGSRTSMAKKNKLEFYCHAAAQFGHFKDAWRNNVSHLRRTYGQRGAKDVMDNTRQFMQHLSSRRK